MRPGPAKELALGAWSLMHGLAVLAVDRQLRDRGFSSDDPAALAKQLAQLFYLGLHP